MKPFEFTCPCRIVFGWGQAGKAAELAAGLGRRALLVTNASSPVAEKVAGLLAAAGVDHVLLEQRGEPTVEHVDAGAALALREKCDVVIGLGGGSAIDCVKAVAAIAANGGSALDYMEIIGAGKRLTRPAMPWIAMPTTAGTGAEVTRNAVIGYPQRQFKASLRSELLLARAAVVDAELGVSAPPAVTAASGMDALCQLIEAYTSNGAGPMTDALALEGLAHARMLPRAFADGADREAREAMALAALLSGLCLANAGLGAVHGFAAALGANFPAPHGVVCAALLPHVMTANIAALCGQAENPTLIRYGRIGQVLTGSASAGAESAVEYAAGLVCSLAIPPLGQFGLRPADVPAMVALARKTSSMKYNPVTLTDDALAAALSAAI